MSEIFTIKASALVLKVSENIDQEKFDISEILGNSEILGTQYLTISPIS